MAHMIAYEKGRCCCGKWNLSPENQDIIHNDIVHQIFGPEGNFCGPKYLHRIKALEDVLKWLDVQGGLGLEKHNKIRTILGEQ